jgi:hypothetical protein
MVGHFKRQNIPTPMSVSLVDIPYPFFFPLIFPLYQPSIMGKEWIVFFGAHALCTVTSKEHLPKELS